MSQKLSPSQIDDLKSSISISEIVGKSVTFDKKKSVPSKGDWWACCPFHGESSPSFHCEDSKGFYYCFGCGAKGDHIEFLMQLHGLSFGDAVRELGGDPSGGIDPDQEKKRAERLKAEAEARETEKELSDDQRAARCQVLFKHAQKPIDGTPAEAYLLSRGLPKMDWGKRLRFIHDLDLPGESYKKMGALVGGVSNSEDKIRAIWRIYLNDDGTPYLDEAGQKVKRGLGPAGGGSVRLSPAGPTICITEGMETGLAVRALTKDREPVFAALSTSGLIGFRVPVGVRAIKIYADGDRERFRDDGKLILPPGKHAATVLAKRLRKDGLEVAINLPPRGSDWLDVWNDVKPV